VNSHVRISLRQNGEVDQLNSFIETLINNARPIDEVSNTQKGNQQVYSQGYTRKLGSDDGEEEEDSSSSSSEEESSKSLLDFSSYSFRYATCQPVQRFSERSVKRGEYSSLVRDDLVIFRFCPQNRCSSTQDFGCNNGYGEYVASMYEYLSTMIQYKKNREQNYCEYCFTCENYRRRDLAYYTDEISVNDDDKANDQTSSTSTYDCSSFSDKCENYSNVCSGGDTSDLSEYIACKEVSYGNKAFWISPYCDDGTIIMGIFYDPYCSQYAGNSVKISEVTGKSFSKSLFSQFYSSDCVTCTSDVSGTVLEQYTPGRLQRCIIVLRKNRSHSLSDLSLRIFVSFTSSQQVRMVQQVVLCVTSCTVIVPNVMPIWRRQSIPQW
jgi:hypothetical protein